VSVICDRLRERAADTTGIGLVAESPTAARAWTWAELCRETAPLADKIAASGAELSVVLIEVDNGMESVISLLAALRTDLPVAVVSRTSPEAEVLALRDALLRNGYRVVLVQKGTTRTLRTRRPCRRPLPAESILLATGGSAGTPKVVVDPRMRTVGLRLRGTRPSSAMNWEPGQRQLVIGPLHHTAALTYFIEAVSDGNTTVVQRVFDPARSLDLIANWGVEWLQLTPYHMRILAATACGRSVDLSSVRGLLHLSAPCPEKVKRTWLDLVGDKHVFEMYGATEPVGVTLARGDEWRARNGTVGKGFFTQLRILDETGRKLPPGVVGDVYMRSAAVTGAGYLDAAHELRLTADGFASVGDRGRLDSDGYLYLESRQVRRIQVGGETVYADEVEFVLGQHPQVRDVAVIGVTDERLGEIVVAIVHASSSDISGRELREFARSRLARHKIPRQVLIADLVPRSGTGKLDRRMLADLARRLGSHRSAASAPTADGGPADDWIKGESDDRC
jgi:bile acid-coenzyme A ligase